MGASRTDARAAFGGRRVTGQRVTIAESADALSGAFTVDELTAAARSRDPRIGVATVYRAVAAMETSGWLERVGERAASALYVRCALGDDHHHHVVCTGCGRVEVAECPLPLAAESPAGFRITRHEVTMYGLCPACVNDGPKA